MAEVSTVLRVPDPRQRMTCPRALGVPWSRFLGVGRGYTHVMPTTRATVKNEKQYEALKEKGMSKSRAAKIANSPDASKHGGKKSGKGGSAKQGGTTAQHKAAGRKGGKAAAKKRPQP
jgi:hypothetical protein